MIEYEKAVHAMERGDKRAKTKVAFCKLSGRGGAVFDAEGAVALLEERVKDKDAEALWMLGMCCEFGIGMEQDIKRAELLYKAPVKSNVVGLFLWGKGKNQRGNEAFAIRGSL